ncbi:MAG TPA: 30S ribosomal protein S12 methylthiotransferase RimO [Syntrophales bacterium]|nr:30S ribosomal protein S12 methylthiotransferase RimO [Syntrophales bacterium]
MKTYHIVSLGCPKNLVDSEVVAAGLEKAGLKNAAVPRKADLVVVNTCAFIEAAREESVDEILRAGQWKKKKGGPFLVVAGCLPQRYGEDLVPLLPEVDAFFGTTAPEDLPPLVQALLDGRAPAGKNFVRPPSFLMDASHRRRLTEPRHTAYLKIAEGCSNRCSYCVIPFIRGPFRSRPAKDVIREAEALARAGVREVVVTAQETTAWGRDLFGRPALHRLLKDLAGIGAFRWIRVLYTHPARIGREFLEVMAAEGSIVNYIDMPIQHVDGDLLKAMNRPGSERDLRERIKTARRIVPDVALRTSLIAGFPGETKEKFVKLLRFVREARFDHLGVFPWSAEEGTPAEKLPGRVRRDVRERRRDWIMEAQAAVSREINGALVGTVQEVLVEGSSASPDYPFVGRARRQAPEIDGVTYVRATDARPGDFIACRIVDAGDYDLFGEELPR